MTKREEVLEYLFKSKLLERCINCQFFKIGTQDFKEDFTQDMWEWVLTYDEDKLYHAYINHHLNALLTRVIQNNIMSTNSPFYKKYKRFINMTMEINTEIEQNTIDGDTEDNLF